MTKLDFIEWLEGVLYDLHMSRADLARASGISASHITRIMNGEQSLGVDAIVDIARAINKPPEEVFRRVAGVTPLPKEENFEKELVLIAHRLKSGELEEVLNYARYRLERQEREADQNEIKRIRTGK